LYVASILPSSQRYGATGTKKKQWIAAVILRALAIEEMVSLPLSRNPTDFGEKDSSSKGPGFQISDLCCSEERVCAFRRITLIDTYITADSHGIQIIVAADLNSTGFRILLAPSGYSKVKRSARLPAKKFTIRSIVKRTPRREVLAF
jgi:hypothetical protein